MSLTFRPYRPRAVALFNLLGRGLEAVGLRTSLAPESLLRAARRRTGLQAFGAPDPREALEVLCRAIDAEANLHPFGRLVMRKRLVDQLCLRLRLADVLRREPDIENIQIGAPLVIAGLQRSGTTLLHRLLAADPDTRALRSWEAVAPLPHPAQRAGKPDRRMAEAEMATRALKYLAPQFFAIHPIDAHAPEEDVLLLEFSFLSQVPEAMLHVPSYARWLDQQDPLPAYRLLKTLLQILHRQQGGTRWVLKTPAHLEHLDALLQVFPDARIIQTHRDPSRTAASYASMLAHGHGVFSDQVDAVGVARHWQAKNARMIERAMAVRDAHPDSFLDVMYADLMRAPMGEIERIYAFAGLELTAGVRAAIEQARSDNRKDKHGAHRYALADFGLEPATVAQDYAAYLQRFHIPEEKPA